MANDATFGKAILRTANSFDFCFVMEHFLFLWSLQQNQDRKHRTYVYVLTVTETLEAWEDSVNIGRVSPPPHLTSSGILIDVMLCILTAEKWVIF